MATNLKLKHPQFDCNSAYIEIKVRKIVKEMGTNPKLINNDGKERRNEMSTIRLSPNLQWVIVSMVKERNKKRA